MDLCASCVWPISNRGREPCNICCVVGALQQYARSCCWYRENGLPKSWRRTGLKDGVPGTTLAAVLIPIHLLWDQLEHSDRGELRMVVARLVAAEDLLLVEFSALNTLFVHFSLSITHLRIWSVSSCARRLLPVCLSKHVALQGNIDVEPFVGAVSSWTVGVVLATTACWMWRVVLTITAYWIRSESIATGASCTAVRESHLRPCAGLLFFVSRCLSLPWCASLWFACCCLSFTLSLGGGIRNAVTLTVILPLSSCHVSSCQCESDNATILSPDDAVCRIRALSHPLARWQVTCFSPKFSVSDSLFRNWRHSGRIAWEHNSVSLVPCWGLEQSRSNCKKKIHTDVLFIGGWHNTENGTVVRSRVVTAEVIKYYINLIVYPKSSKHFGNIFWPHTNYQNSFENSGRLGTLLKRL